MIDMPKMNVETYIGDGVYVSCDGYQLWLRTGDGNNQRIALEPAVIQSLVAFASRFGSHFLPEKTK